MKPVLEVCTHSVESAVSAERGGAMRLELCANLMIGGTSPDEDLFRMVRERVSVPVRVLLRPRAGDFLYDEDEFELLCCQAARFAGLGADGIVIGMLNPDGTLDAERMSALMTCGDGCGVTLHRAFDVCRDAHEALRTAKELGVDTILTSGQQARCADGAPLLRELVSESGEGLRIVREVYGAEPDSSTIEYYRFITHLKFFARRIVGSQKYGDEDTDLLEVVRFKYPRAFACAEKICSYVLTEKGFRAGDNELLYLTIHIARVMKDN